MAEPARPYTKEEMDSDAVSKKDLITWLQANASIAFCAEHKLKGILKNLAKTKTKDTLIADYNALFEQKAFKKEGEDAEAAAAAAAAEKAKAEQELADKAGKLDISSAVAETPEVPKYKKVVQKKGDKINIPRKGDTVAVWYKGMFTDGKVFDTNIVTGRKAKSTQPLRFKVGTGKVIKGWDHVILTMSVGEKVEVTIEPEWAYGRKGTEGIPPHSTLVFEIELAAMQ